MLLSDGPHLCSVLEALCHYYHAEFFIKRKVERARFGGAGPPGINSGRSNQLRGENSNFDPHCPAEVLRNTYSDVRPRSAAGHMAAKGAAPTRTSPQLTLCDPRIK